MVSSRDEVYRKFGETAEAAQLLETELGTLLLAQEAAREDLFVNENPERAAELLSQINAHTLGKLLKLLKPNITSIDELEALLLKALAERNRLSHSFYRQHNVRINSEEGRALMLQDLESVHVTVWDAYKAVMLVSGIDLDAVAEQVAKSSNHNGP
jgi:hypothetical protein